MQRGGSRHVVQFLQVEPERRVGAGVALVVVARERVVRRQVQSVAHRQHHAEGGDILHAVRDVVTAQARLFETALGVVQPRGRTLFEAEVIVCEELVQLAVPARVAAVQRHVVRRADSRVHSEHGLGVFLDLARTALADAVLRDTPDRGPGREVEVEIDTRLPLGRLEQVVLVLDEALERCVIRDLTDEVEHFCIGLVVRVVKAQRALELVRRLAAQADVSGDLRALRVQALGRQRIRVALRQRRVGRERQEIIVLAARGHTQRRRQRAPARQLVAHRHVAPQHLVVGIQVERALIRAVATVDWRQPAGVVDTQHRDVVPETRQPAARLQHELVVPVVRHQVHVQHGLVDRLRVLQRGAEAEGHGVRLQAVTLAHRALRFELPALRRAIPHSRIADVRREAERDELRRLQEVLHALRVRARDQLVPALQRVRQDEHARGGLQPAPACHLAEQVRHFLVSEVDPEAHAIGVRRLGRLIRDESVHALNLEQVPA